MNLLFISHGLKDPDAWRLALGIEKCIHLDNPDKLRGFEEISLALDDMIWVNQYPIDWVLYCNNEKGIKWSEFLALESFVDVNSDTMFLTQTLIDNKGRSVADLNGNFYCRPHLFTLLGSVYKLQNKIIDDSDQLNKVSTSIFFGLARGGYNIKLI